jgi:hypothetical protein
MPSATGHSAPMTPAMSAATARKRTALRLRRGTDKMSRGHGGEKSGGGYPARGEQSCPERRAERNAGTQRVRGSARQRCKAGAQRGERGELGHGFMGVHHETDTAEQQEQRRCSSGVIGVADPVSRRAEDQPERTEHKGAAREPRRRMEFDCELKQLAEHERHPVVQRRIVEPGPAAHSRHDELAAFGHVVHDAQADRVVRLPQIVASETRQRKGERHERERRGRQRQPECRNGGTGDHRPPGAYSAFFSTGFLV